MKLAMLRHVNIKENFPNKNENKGKKKEKVCFSWISQFQLLFSTMHMHLD
jgi:hypothetical protein